jgi:hypothetical protein
VFAVGDPTCAPKVYRQGSTLGGVPESGDRLGTTLANRRYRDDFDEDVYDTLLIGVPGEDASTGLVQLATGTPRTLSAVPGPAEHSVFGTFIANDAVGPSF